MNSYHEENRIDKYFDLQIFKRLFEFTKPYMHFFIISMTLLIFVTIMDLSRPYLIKIIIDNYLVGKVGSMDKTSLYGIIKLSTIFIIIYIFRFIFAYAQRFILNYAAQKQIYDMRQKLFKHILSQSISFFDANPVGRLSTRITNDMKNINEMYTNVFIEALKDILLVFGTIIAMLILNFRMALICFLLAPLIYIATYIFRIKARAVQRKLKVKIARINAMIFESLSGIQIIQVFNKEQESKQAFEDINIDHLNSSLEEVIIYGLFRPSIHFIHSMALALIIYYGGSQGLNRAIELGVLFAFIRYIDQMFFPIFNLSDKFGVLQSAMASAERVFLLFDTNTSLPQIKNPTPLDDFKGEIEFKNVWFSYDYNTCDNTDCPENIKWILKDVSFHIHAGQTAAFVGSTGSGKSTIISLINRFYDIQKGQILIDNKDIKSLSISELRSKMGIVLQDVFLFSGSIKKNINLGDGNIDLETLKYALTNAQAMNFIKSLPNKYEHIVQERGNNFSSGERQLLSLARALARKPKILIFDEATSHIDTQTESIIQQTIDNSRDCCTTILVAHRLSTIKNADNIFLIDNGILSEQGTHDELIKLNDKYANLYFAQNLTDI